MILETVLHLRCSYVYAKSDVLNIPRWIFIKKERRYLTVVCVIVFSSGDVTLRPPHVMVDSGTGSQPTSKEQVGE